MPGPNSILIIHQLTVITKGVIVPSSWWDGHVLKKVRQRRKLTQEALAKRMGVYQVTIARLESGSRQPSMDMLQRLAKALKVTVKDLLP